MSKIDQHFVGKYSIIRTYSAGNWAGVVSAQEGCKIILTNARRLWRWKCNKGISLSSIATYGVDHNQSKIPCAVTEVFLEAIEIIPATEIAEKTIVEAPECHAE